MQTWLRNQWKHLPLLVALGLIGWGCFRWGIRVGEHRTLTALQAERAQAKAKRATTRYEVTPGGPRRSQSQLWFEVEDGQTAEGSYCRGRVRYRQSGLPAHVLIVATNKETGEALGQVETDPGTGAFEITTAKKVSEWSLAALKPGSRLTPRPSPEKGPTT
jgi:hypothetical protein